MYRRNLFLTSILGLAIFTVALAWSGMGNPPKGDHSCQESMESADEPDGPSTKLLWESLPGQFLSKF